MQLFNLEIFDRNINLIYHSTCQLRNLKDDYLSLSENSIDILNGTSKIKPQSYIRFQNKNKEYIYLITSAEFKQNNIMTVKFKSILSLLDRTVVFDTSKQGSNESLESVISKLIYDLYINSKDDFEMMGIVPIISDKYETKKWGFNLKADKEGTQKIIINLYQTIIIKAFEKYQIVVTPKINLFEENYIEFKIEKIMDEPIYIEADLKNIISKNIKVKKNDSSTNKYIIYRSDYSNKIIYYLHDDYSYDTNSKNNRIIPVISEITTVDVNENTNFEEQARNAASQKFSGKTYDNLIEIEVLKTDALIKPYELKIGQLVKVISEGNIYESILSCRELTEHSVKLSFGTVRTDLISKIKRRMNKWE